MTSTAPHPGRKSTNASPAWTATLRDWRRWGPYVAERSWGTVREDYSAEGHAWDFLSHDLARSTAYRWGEDGFAGFCDRYQILVLAFALWNERDPNLKERAFGLTPAEGNHGEDVKEYYFYLGRDTYPLLHEVALQTSIARLSLPAADRRELFSARRGTGVRTAGHRYLRRRSVLRRDRGVRQGVARGPRHPRHDPQPWSRCGANPPPPPSLVSEYMDVERALRAGTTNRARADSAPSSLACWQMTGRRHRRAVSCSSTAWVRGISTSRRAAQLLFTDNETNTSGLSTPERE